MSEAANNEVKQPEFHIQRVYIKDVSFEAPNTPHIFQKEWQRLSEALPIFIAIQFVK